MKRHIGVTAALAMAALLITACQTTRYAGDENSPFYRVPVGSRVIVNREVAIAPDNTGAYLQYGRVLPFSEVGKYYPHCKLELRTREERARAVRPDELEVTRSVQEESHSVGLDDVRLAATLFGLLANDNDGGGPSLITFATRLSLRSASQPGIFRLSCGQWGYPPRDGHVTIQEMRKTLGDLITLQLAPPPGR